MPIARDLFRRGLALALFVVLLPASTATGAQSREGTARAPKSFPQVGDSWTYRLTLLRQGRESTQSSVVVRVTDSSADKIVDEVSRDGGAPSAWTHSAGHYMVPEVVLVFSPYLTVFGNPAPGSKIWRVMQHDDVCFVWVHCSTVGTVEGRETIQIPAGTFDTIKVTLEHARGKRQGPAFLGGMNSATTTIWYSPQAKRAVKVMSRLSNPKPDGRNGSRSAFHATFDLELVSYRLQSASLPSGDAVNGSAP